MTPKKRIQSVDFLRGITIVSMILVNTPGSWSYVYPPLLHAKWHGLTPTDLVFPFFLFIVGISISFVYESKKGDPSAPKKIVIRSMKIIVLGFFLSIFLPYYPFFSSLETVRIPGVLQRIGIVFLIVSILYLNLDKKSLLAIAFFLLIGYWIWLVYIPLPDGTLPSLERGPDNWANYLDHKILGKHMWKSDYDPEGILSTLPSIVTAIIGTFIGQVLTGSKNNKYISLSIIGFSLLLTGYLWSIFFPINKALWSSSFVLVTSGYATIFLMLVHYVTDHKRFQLGNVFKYVGANAILLYFMSSIITKCFYLIKVDQQHTIHQWLFETFFIHDSLDKTFSSLLYALAVVGFYMLLAYFLYRKKIFVKI